MRIPTIHLNGTGKERLLNAYETALASLEQAYNDLKQAAPNGRDYYVQGNTALDEATIEHMRRLRSVDEAMRDIGEIVEGIREQ